MNKGTELKERIERLEKTVDDIDKEITNGTHSKLMIDAYIECYNDQKQLLEWLKELKEYRRAYRNAIAKIENEKNKLNAEGDFVYSVSEIKVFDKCLEILKGEE